MGIVLTVLEPPHQPHPNLLAALPPGVGRVIDLEPRLVSPRYDTLLVTANGLVVRDPGTGGFHGVPWSNFSLEQHLRYHSRHAILTLWIEEHRPVELAIDRRLALNIAIAAPVLQQHPGAVIDNVVVADRLIDPADNDVFGRSAGQSFTVQVGYGHEIETPQSYRPDETAADYQLESVPVDLAPSSIQVAGDEPEPANLHALHNVATRAAAKRRRKRALLTALALTMLLAAAAAGSLASIYANGEDGDNIRLLTSEPIELD